MKRNLFGIAAILCALSVVFAGCDNKPIVPPAPPYLSVVGTITDVENRPLESMQVTIFLPEVIRLSGEYEQDTYICYTDSNGQYDSGTLSCWAITEGLSWPEEITVSAIDTSGVYEELTITVPMESYPRYPDGKWKRYIDAKAQADFVLHKE